MALIDNLVSYWKLDESSGSRADSHGSNTLTDNNTVLSATGIIGNAADFESTNSEYLSITDAAQSGLDFSTAMSWSFWYKPESDTDAVVISKFNTSQQAFWIQIQTGGSNDTIKFVNSAENEVSAVHGALSNGTWYHFVVTYNAGTVTFYMNGSSLGGGSNGTSLTNTTSELRLSSVQKYGSNFVDGLLDEVACWSKVLDSGEVTSLYNAGAGLAYPFSATTVPSLASLGVGA